MSGPNILLSDNVVESAAKAAAEVMNGGDFDDPAFYAPQHRELWMKAQRAALQAAIATANAERPISFYLDENTTAHELLYSDQPELTDELREILGLDGE